MNDLKNLTLESPYSQVVNPSKMRTDVSYCAQLLRDIRVLSQGGGTVDIEKYKKFFEAPNETNPAKKFNGVITKSISRRFADLIFDAKDLYNTKPSGKDSYEGHQRYMEKQLTALRSAVQEFEDYCSQGGLNIFARKTLGQAGLSLKTPVPEKPNERLRELIRQPNIDWKQVADVVIDILKQAGVIGWAVLTAIAAAIVSAISFFLTPNGKLGHTPLSEKDVAQLINGKDPLSQSLVSSNAVTSQSSNPNLSEALSMLDKMRGGNSSSFTSASSSTNPDIAAGLNILDQIKKDLQKDKEPALSNAVDKDPVVPNKSRDNGIGGR